MTNETVHAARRCPVVYRATGADGKDAEIRLRLDPAAATLADAWARFTARYGAVDPRSIEIEIHEAARDPAET